MSVIYNKLKQVEHDQGEEIALKPAEETPEAKKEVLPLDETLVRHNKEKKAKFIRNMLIGAAICSLAITLSVVTIYIRGHKSHVTSKFKGGQEQSHKNNSSAKTVVKTNEKTPDTSEQTMSNLPLEESKPGDGGRQVQTRMGPPESVLAIQKEYAAHLAKQKTVKPVENTISSKDMTDGQMEIGKITEKTDTGIVKPPTKSSEELANIKGGYQQFIPGNGRTIPGSGRDGKLKFIDPAMLLKSKPAQKDDKAIKGLNKSDNDVTKPVDVKVADLDKKNTDAQAVKQPVSNKKQEETTKAAAKNTMAKEKAAKEDKPGSNPAKLIASIKKADTPAQEKPKETAAAKKIETGTAKAEKNNPNRETLLAMATTGKEKTKSAIGKIPPLPNSAIDKSGGNKSAQQQDKPLNNAQLSKESKDSAEEGGDDDPELALVMREGNKPEQTTKDEADTDLNKGTENLQGADKRRALLEMGQKYYQQNKLDEAIKIYRRALEEDPELLEAYNNLGVIYTQKGWFKSAIKNLKSAIRSSPYYADAYYNLAVLYEKQADNKQALIHYLKFLEYAQPKHRQLVEQVQKHISYY